MNVWDRKGYLGNVQIVRTDGSMDSLHVSEGNRGFLAYCRVPSSGIEEEVILKPTDRKTAQLVMDDTRERMDVLRARLVADRWKNIAEHG